MKHLSLVMIKFVFPVGIFNIITLKSLLLRGGGHFGHPLLLGYRHSSGGGYRNGNPLLDILYQYGCEKNVVMQNQYIISCEPFIK